MRIRPSEGMEYISEKTMLAERTETFQGNSGLEGRIHHLEQQVAALSSTPKSEYQQSQVSQIQHRHPPAHYVVAYTSNVERHQSTAQHSSGIPIVSQTKSNYPSYNAAAVHQARMSPGMGKRVVKCPGPITEAVRVSPKRTPLRSY